MGCSIRAGGVTYGLPAAIGTYDLLEAVAIAIAEGASFWLEVRDNVGLHRIWLSPAQSIDLLNDGDYSGAPRQERVDVLVRTAIDINKMAAGIAYAFDEDFEAGVALAREQQAERDAAAVPDADRAGD